MLLPSLIGVATVLSTLVSGLPVAVPQNHGVSLHLKRNPSLMPLDEVLIASQAPFKREAAPEPQFRMKTMSALGAVKDAIKIAAEEGKKKAKAKLASGKKKAKEKAKEKGIILFNHGLKTVYGNVPRKREAAPDPQFRMKAMSALGAAKDAIKIAAKQGGNKAKSTYATGKSKTKSAYASGKAKTKSAYASGKAKTKSAYASGKAKTKSAYGSGKAKTKSAYVSTKAQVKSAYVSTKAQVKNLPNLPEDIVRKIYNDPRPPKTAKREAAPQGPITTPQVPKYVTEPVKKGAVDSKKKVPKVVQSAKQKLWYNMVTSLGKDFTKREASPEPGTKIDAIKALVRPVKESVVASKKKVTSKVKDKYKAKKASRKSKKVDKAKAKWEAQRSKDLQATL